MSYINDALHKVQQEKESPYASYGDVVSAEGKKPDDRRKWFSVVVLLLVFFFVAGLGVILNWPDIRKTYQMATPAQNPVVAAARPVHSVQGVSPALVPDATAPAAPVEVVAPLSPNIKETPAAGDPLTTEGKGKKHHAVVTGNEPKPKASPKPLPANPESLYAQALQKQREGSFVEARDLYRKVIKQEPRNIQALNNLGVIHLKLNNYKLAIARFNDALDIKHNYVDAHYNLACLYAQKNDTKKSMVYLKNAMDFNPEARLWAMQDDDLKNLADLPEFNKILQARDK